MNIKVFDAQMFATLDKNAKESARDRSNCNIHDDYSSPVQRLFITLYPNSYVRPHIHVEPSKWEFFLMVSGEISFLLFSEEGECTHRFELSADGESKGIEIPPDTWHCVVPKTEAATFFEVKQGPYVAIDDKGFASWSPAEGEPGVPTFLEGLKALNVGEKMQR